MAFSFWLAQSSLKCILELHSRGRHHHNGLVFPHQLRRLIIKEIPSQVAYKPILWRYYLEFLNCGPLLSDKSSLCQVATKLVNGKVTRGERQVSCLSKNFKEEKREITHTQNIALVLVRFAVRKIVFSELYNVEHTLWRMPWPCITDNHGSHGKYSHWLVWGFHVKLAVDKSWAYSFVHWCQFAV